MTVMDADNQAPAADSHHSVAPLFEPVSIGKLKLKNRLVMAPMTRSFSPGGVPGQDVADYYRRRAEADVPLIITEGVWVEHAGAGNDPNVPRFYGDDALAGWKRVLDAVHGAGGLIMPQLWHIGYYYTAPVEGFATEWGHLRPDQVGPSGMGGSIGVAPNKMGEPMTPAQIDHVIDAFAKGGETAYRLGFDGVALHGGHGYLIDQFFWGATNLRDDDHGGDIRKRTRFAADVISEIRRRTAPDFPIMLRFSQWKLQDYGARLAETPQELAQILEPLVDAGVDIIDGSQRRFWEPAFEGSDLNLAGWAKKLTGKPSMTVGSVGLDKELMTTLAGAASLPASLDRLLERLERHEFDLVAVGRALLVDPEWASKVKAGDIATTRPYTAEALYSLS